jgi:hypothetical protein
MNGRDSKCRYECIQESRINFKQCRLDLGIGSGVLVIRWGDDDNVSKNSPLLLPEANKWGVVSLIPVLKNNFSI